MVTVGVHVRENAGALQATLASLARFSPEVPVVLLPDDPDAALARVLASLEAYPRLAGTARGAPAAFNRLVAFDAARVVVLLESGSIVTPGWLDRLCAALAAEPGVGLAGPSTNLAWNAQRARGAPEPEAAAERIEAFARTLADRCGDARSAPEPKHSLSDFCVAVKREVVDAIGGADEEFGEGPCWEMEYNARAAAAGYRGVWVCGTYVHRLPIGLRRRQAEARLFSAARARYHRRVRALQEREPARSGAAVVTRDTPRLVSCIMPTRDRRPFVARAVAQFLAQDYADRELIVVDDGADSIADLLPSDARIRLIRPPRRLSIGAKRNLACETARGEFVAHWDDDDWMASWRLRYQVEALLRSGADACGLARLYFYDPAAGRAWEYEYPESARRWVAGGTLCYRSALWRAHPFPDVNEGEDTRFVWALRGVKLLALDDPKFYVATVHPGNTSRKRTAQLRYRPCPISTIDDIMRPAEAPLVSCIMPTGDRLAFVPLAVDYFLRQDYPNRELIVVDDGRERVRHLLPADSRLRYVPVARTSIGAKRNIALREAAGTYIAHWDDDDWYAPGRLSAQLRPLLAGEADVTALSMRHVLALPAMRFWRCEPALHARLHYRDLCCGTIVYPRCLWETRGPYPAFNIGEDVRFLQRAAAGGARVRRLDDDELFVCVRHGRNTWRIARDWTRPVPGWTPTDPPPLFGQQDAQIYRAMAGVSADVDARLASETRWEATP
jgi:glycosyltransferase involved in cell wall biosynthesis